MAVRKTVLITGATGGIGTAFARAYVRNRYNLVLCDVNEERLQAMAQQLQQEYKCNVKVLVANLAATASVDDLIVQLQGIRIDAFVAAAGYGEKMLFAKEDIQASVRMIHVHSISVVQLIHAILPQMLKRRKGDIIAVSSLAAFIPAPGSSIYSATKAFVNSFIESLHMEVGQKGIRVQSLCPGLTHTGFHKEADIKRFDKIKGLNLWMEADEVVAASLQGLEDGHVVCIPGFINKSIKHTVPAIPRQSFYKLVAKLTDIDR
ncbi:MAG: SDR family NAD(P)-dependent oxidoreductase [Flavipsychrobacter sp.]